MNIIGISETKINSSATQPMINLNIPGYKFEHVPTLLLFGGVRMYICSKLNYSVIEKLSNNAFQAMWVEIHFEPKKNIICAIMYICRKLNYSVIEKISNDAFQAMWVEIHFEPKKNIICAIIYRQHNSLSTFLSYIDEALEKYSTGKPVYILGDFNLDLLKFETYHYSHDFLLSLQSCHFLPTIDKPTETRLL